MLYVHDMEQGITLPQHPHKIFAVINVKGTQYKIVKDDRVIMDNLNLEGLAIGK